MQDIVVSCEKNLRFASISDDAGRYDEIVTVKREHRVRHANHCPGPNRTLRAFQRGKSPDYALVRRSGLFDLGRMENARFFNHKIDLLHFVIPVEVEVHFVSSVRIVAKKLAYHVILVIVPACRAVHQDVPCPAAFHSRSGLETPGTEHHGEDKEARESACSSRVLS